MSELPVTYCGIELHFESTFRQTFGVPLDVAFPKVVIYVASVAMQGHVRVAALHSLDACGARKQENEGIVKSLPDTLVEPSESGRCYRRPECPPVLALLWISCAFSSVTSLRSPDAASCPHARFLGPYP